MRLTAGNPKCPWARQRAALVLSAFLAAISMAGSSSAEEPAKAPAGSYDRAIWASSYCLGQAMARGAKFKDLFTANSQQVKSLQDQQSGADPARRGTKIDELEVSALYLTRKMLLLSSEIGWMYKMAAALGRHVENPDPKILHDGMDRGKAAGDLLFGIEHQCQAKCIGPRDAAELGSCVDSCAQQENHMVFGAAKECDRLYANSVK